MEEARHAIEAFLARNGHHDTTVHETVAPAVTHELVTRTEHRNLTRAVDREIHQDHYHTSVQPITQEERSEEQNHNVVQDVEEQNFEYGDPEDTSRRLAELDAEYQNSREEVIAESTTTELPTIEGLHVHHHVHERIQPVIDKRTYETHIYHVVVPVREIHHNAAHYHPSSPLATVTLDQFKQAGGTLNGREERYDAFEGEPRAVSKALSGQTSFASPATGGDPQGGLVNIPAPNPQAQTDNAPAAAPPAKVSRVATFADPIAAPRSEPIPQSEFDPTTIASRTAPNSGIFRLPTRVPTAPATSLAPDSTAPTPDTSDSVPAPLPRAPTAPPTFAPTALAREPTIPPSHPLMRPATHIPREAYRQGLGRAGTGHARPSRSRPAARSRRTGSPPSPPPPAPATQ
ncbi:hypothetical protein SMMN14_07396 [Sphaerulina musiva]